jgi:hypothetical protein
MVERQAQPEAAAAAPEQTMTRQAQRVALKLAEAVALVVSRQLVAMARQAVPVWLSESEGVENGIPQCTRGKNRRRNS